MMFKVIEIDGERRLALVFDDAGVQFLRDAIDRAREAKSSLTINVQVPQPGQKDNCVGRGEA